MKKKPTQPQFEDFDPSTLTEDAAPVATQEDADGLFPEQFKYSQQDTFDSHLFKLLVSSGIKDVGYHGSPYLIQYEHNHFFHTVDSNGVEQHKSTAIAGHFHKIDIEVTADGKKKIVCGPPVTEKKTFDKIAKRWKTEFVQVTQGNELDTHTHVVKYEKTDRLSKRKLNDKAAIIISTDAQKVTSIPGIIG